MTSIFKQSGVYRITHIPSGAVYIGSSHNLGHRLGCHKRALLKKKHHNRFLQSLWDQSSENDWSWEFGVTSSEGFHLRFEERVIIDQTPRHLLLNIKRVAGSDHHRPGGRMSLESKERRRLALLGRKRNKTIKAKIKKGMASVWEARRRGDAPMPNYGMSPEARAKIRAKALGRKHTQATKDKIREKRSHQVMPRHSDVAKEKVRAARLAYWEQQRSKS